MAAFARALEVIPRQLAENAGFDSTDILNKLRHVHTSSYVKIAAREAREVGVGQGWRTCDWQ